MKINIKTISIIAAIIAATATGGIYAKTVPGAGGPFSVTPLPNPTFNNPATIHGFDDIGLIQATTVSGADCPSLNPIYWGGTVQINGATITVPCNTIVQFSASSILWPAAVSGGLTATATLPAAQLNVIGNVVDGRPIAGLMYISRNDVSNASGIIQSINYSDGTLNVKMGGATSLSATVVVKINDPKGRFGRPQAGTDTRFSVDDENPTIHSATGYPMCIPRTDPATKDDSLCPQKNRPVAPCRLFGAAGVSPLPFSGELSNTPSGFCTQFVMKALSGSKDVVTNTPVLAAYIASNTDPDPRQQAPFEVGDSILFSGTTVSPGVIHAHTVEGNVGIYTQPSTLPSYQAIGEFGVGTANPALTFNGIAQETTDRIFLETQTTDVKTPIDVYIVDKDTAGNQQLRWISPYEVTLECNPVTGLATTCLGLSGGITTQFTQAQPQRARVRTSGSQLLKIGFANGLVYPGRALMVMARSLCKPGTDLGATTGHSASLDTCFAAAVNAANKATTVVSGKTITANANGLVAGRYSAPVPAFLFPENTKPGDPLVPNDFWNLPFLRYGDGDAGGLIPYPWNGNNP